MTVMGWSLERRINDEGGLSQASNKRNEVAENRKPEE